MSWSRERRQIWVSMVAMLKCGLIVGLVVYVGFTEAYAQTLRDSLSIVAFKGCQQYGLPLNVIDSIKFPFAGQRPVAAFFVDTTEIVIASDSMLFRPKSDTLYLVYEESCVVVSNPRIDLVDVVVSSQSNSEVVSDRADVIVTMHCMPELVISVSGQSCCGSLSVLADTSYTLSLNGVHLRSVEAPAFQSVSKQKVSVDLVDGTDNFLEDDTIYASSDAAAKVTDSNNLNGCFNAMGPVNFSGTGTLTLMAHRKHAVYGKKDLSFQDGPQIHVVSAPADGIHAGKSIELNGADIIIEGQGEDGIDAGDDIGITCGYIDVTVSGTGYKAVKADGNINMAGGELHLDLQGPAAKGIKTKQNAYFSGGIVTGTSCGDVFMEDNDPSYSSFIKSDGNITIDGGTFTMVNNGSGGRCITCDGNLTVNGGELALETNGDGTEYVNAAGDKDYYTPRCIAAKDSIKINRGDIHCLSTGLGGKGIVSDNYMSIGLEADSIYTCGPMLVVETTDSCIINDVNEDLRFGCPKAIKADSLLYIYSGDIHVTTHGMGGEGIECNDEMYIYGGNVECNTFDDGMNIGNKLEINGGQVYCNSIDNDGIDSNGSITVNGGIVASVNQKKPNESFDTEGQSFFINGGIVFGIGSAMVNMGNEKCLYYNTLYSVEEGQPSHRGLLLTSGKYAYLMRGEKLLMSLRTENENKRKFVTMVWPSFVENGAYSIEEGDAPLNPEQSLFGERLFIGGAPVCRSHVIDFQPKYNYNY